MIQVTSITDVSQLLKSATLYPNRQRPSPEQPSARQASPPATAARSDSDREGHTSVGTRISRCLPQGMAPRDRKASSGGKPGRPVVGVGFHPFLGRRPEAELLIDEIVGDLVLVGVGP